MDKARILMAWLKVCERDHVYFSQRHNADVRLRWWLRVVMRYFTKELRAATGNNRLMAVWNNSGADVHEFNPETSKRIIMRFELSDPLHIEEFPNG